LNVVDVCVVEPTRLGPRYSPYPATEVLSVDGDHDIVRFEPAVETTRNDPGTVGGTVSDAGGLVGLSVIVTRATMPWPAPVSVDAHFTAPETV
jgi:hypothetical protein